MPLAPEMVEPLKLQTRRQSRGLQYFDRLRPKVRIDVGSLEDWFNDNYK